MDSPFTHCHHSAFISNFGCRYQMLSARKSIGVAQPAVARERSGGVRRMEQMSMPVRLQIFFAAN